MSSQAGIILCCLGCAIFGITEVPTDGLEFDTGGYGAMAGGTGPIPTQAPEKTSTSPIYVPPPAAQTSAAPTIIPTPDPATTTSEPPSQPTPPQPVDLLDDARPSEGKQDGVGEIHELD